MRRARGLGGVCVAACLLGACAVDHGVQTRSAAQVPAIVTSATDEPTTDPDPTGPDPSGPATTDPATTEPGRSAPGTTEPGPDPTVPDRADVLDVGDAKPERAYDAFLVAVLADLERWWAEQYPALYGGQFEPLRGGVYAGYPERTTPIPGCGRDDETTYDELTLFAAFYCPDGDFMAYDDGEQGVLYTLADEFGPSILGVVLSHEYGHAIQQRAGVLSTQPPTILTEQQADCFSGAWMARAAAGGAAGIEITDRDIRSGLIAMITVRDPIGIDQFTPGGHGSAFDRVGAFQAGFADGAARCVGLIDDPLPLMPNVFTPDNVGSDGNADFGYAEGEIVHFTVEDLNAFWATALGASADEPFPTLTVEPFADPAEVSCDDPVGDPDVGALYCRETREVWLDEPLALRRYGDFGDFAVAYMLSTAWSEAAQDVLDSPLQDEDRALLSDCFTGAWSRTLIPDETGASSSATNVRIEPGDLDEAIQTALVVGDASSTEDVLGSPFEKIAAFRSGVIGSVDACQDLLAD